MSTLLEYLRKKHRDEHHRRTPPGPGDSPFILNDFRSSVSYSATRSLRDLIPNDLGQTKDRERDEADSTATCESGETTNGLVNNAWALFGTTKIASNDGHSTGPPAENA